MSDELTLCKECNNLYVASKNDQPGRWMCIKHKRLPVFGFVTHEAWENFPPYLFCRDVNGGACPLFRPKRDGQMEMINEPPAHS